VTTSSGHGRERYDASFGDDTTSTKVSMKRG
jgi:hypothetical protein